jgi:hypothetical protein
MDLDDQMRKYFGTADIAAIPPAALAAGAEHMLVDFGLETDRDRRFALWALMYMLGVAPELSVAFTREEDREAARNLADLIARIDENGGVED